MLFIPLVNRVISILTLEIFQPNWFIQSLIIAFEIGFAPAFIQEFLHYQSKMSYYKKVLKQKTFEKMHEKKFTLVTRWPLMPFEVVKESQSRVARIVTLLVVDFFRSPA